MKSHKVILKQSVFLLLLFHVVVAVDLRERWNKMIFLKTESFVLKNIKSKRLFHMAGYHYFLIIIWLAWIFKKQSYIT